jgi:hypothetical protein
MPSRLATPLVRRSRLLACTGACSKLTAGPHIHSLFPAPRPLTGALSLAPIIPIASSSNLPPSSASAPKSRMYVPPPKPVRLQPLDKMKFRNAAFGGGADLPVEAALDDEAAPAPAPIAAAQTGGKEAKAEKKSKKRKEVGEAGEAEAKDKKKKKPKVK